MIPYRSTPVPNVIFDYYMRILKPTELALLLLVIRQTWGWYDTRTQRRKSRDWISGSQLRLKTGYSRKAISQAIEQLGRYQLIKVFDSAGRELISASERKGKIRLYYALHIPSLQGADITCVKTTHDMRIFYAQQSKQLQKKMTLSL